MSATQMRPPVEAAREPASGEPPLDAPENPLAHLSREQIEELGRELDALHQEVYADLGERDARYIRSIIAFHRGLALGSRVLLIGSRRRPLWLLGTAALSLAKILENMEIGHNVMHGQWDWMNDPDINSRNWDWDTASPADAWRHSHNYEHHTFTNIRGKDRDLGYEIMRIDPQQRWHPIYVLQPLYNLVLMGFFEWGVALHDLNFDAIRAGEKPKSQALAELKAIGVKARRQIVKDYIAFPVLSAAAGALAGRRRGAARKAAREVFTSTFKANFTANIVRNVWAHSIIFCGHFPDQTYTFSEEEAAEETRGGWYARQLLGAANIDGSPAFHLLSGNLSFQVEHHLFPDMPSSRYAEIAPRVRDICARYGLPYNTGPLRKQLGAVHRTILRLALPGGKPRPKPGPYRAA
ncbi:MAG TPA: acyl-CoA desaturase [Solirubrobacteraceae bacterium]|jgi:linoleoyl-CoA desaturase|nr:acyl-CoA desaturase [Solirubrobacteraceae bacterium]